MATVRKKLNDTVALRNDDATHGYATTILPNRSIDYLTSSFLHHLFTSNGLIGSTELPEVPIKSRRLVNDLKRGKHKKWEPIQRFSNPRQLLDLTELGLSLSFVSPKPKSYGTDDESVRY
ncbi:hypothetical protein E2C01_010548 [Portunus trituberculatus]|uniref:Uncharacterized protein n=1 Tax=Portunus trituberculatus TaxID=210409 RepID=A0A5B7D8S2_PORTR|nr:hypothetical protein [Portunus trituberculatus]